MPALESYSRGPSKSSDFERTRRPKDVLEETEQQWLYTEAELLRTPSICDGMKPEEERTFRHKGHSFITQVGIMLKLPQITLGTATVFFNRFLMRYSLKGKNKGEKPLHHYQIAATALFLATKVEEHCRKVKELVIACCRVAQKNPNLLVDENTKDYWRWRDTIINHEDLLLELLCFDLSVESPYNILFGLLQHYRLDKHRKLRDSAWSFINDSHLTQACLLFNPRTIACAAFYCGAKHTDTQIPDNETSQPWWEAQHIQLREIRRACNYMADFYSNALGGLKPGSEGIYVGLRSSLDESDEGASSTRLIKSQTPNTPGAATMERSGSERSLKRERVDDEHTMDAGTRENGHPRGQQSQTNGHRLTQSSRIPAEAQGSAQMTGERSTKRLKTNNDSAVSSIKTANGLVETTNGAQGKDWKENSRKDEGEHKVDNEIALQPQKPEENGPPAPLEDVGSEEVYDAFTPRIFPDLPTKLVSYEPVSRYAPDQYSLWDAQGLDAPTPLYRFSTSPPADWPSPSHSGDTPRFEDVGLDPGTTTEYTDAMTSESAQSRDGWLSHDAAGSFVSAGLAEGADERAGLPEERMMLESNNSWEESDHGA